MRASSVLSIFVLAVSGTFAQTPSVSPTPQHEEKVIVTSILFTPPEEPIRLRHGATEAGDGFYVHISFSHAVDGTTYPKNTIWFLVRVPRYVQEAELSDGAIRIEDRHGQFLGDFFSSPRSGGEADKERVFDVVAVPELAKRIRLTIVYTKETKPVRTVTRQYELELGDYLPKKH